MAAEQSTLHHRKSAEALEWSAVAQEKNVEVTWRMVVAQEEITCQMVTVNSSLKEIVWHLPRMTLKESTPHPGGTPLPGVTPQLRLTICWLVKCLQKESPEVMEMDEDEDGGGEGSWS